jgi:hypothetical protein
MERLPVIPYLRQSRQKEETIRIDEQDRDARPGARLTGVVGAAVRFEAELSAA